jgi:hypothetical protein
VRQLSRDPGCDGPRIPTPIVVVAWKVLNSSDREAAQAGKTLAKLVIEASERQR